MTQPARKPGGLYGGIQFSSSTSFTPSISENTSLSEAKPTSGLAEVQQPTSAEPTADAGANESPAQAQEPEAGKSTAGIRLLSEPI